MENIIIIGTDYEAERFWYINRKDYNVVLWLDENPRRPIFLNRTAVLAYNSFDFLRNKIKVVIATNKERYLKYANELMQKGLIEFEDFIYYEAVNKEMAIFWGNCHIEDLRDRLLEYSEFSSKYWVYPMVNIDAHVRAYIPTEVYNNCKLFIYQNVKSETNGTFYSSKYMLENLNNEAIKIQIPNLYRKGFGFFPQAKYVPLDLMRETERMFVSYTDDHDVVIEEKYAQGSNANEISYLIKYGDVFSKEEVEEKFEKYMSLIKKEDENNDVKIYEYILENYTKKCIFIDPGHVSNNVYNEYISQIFKLLNMEIDKIESDSFENELIFPIYGCVKKYLKLDWYNVEQTIREKSFTLTGDQEGVGIDEYVKEYIFLCITR